MIVQRRDLVGNERETLLSYRPATLLWDDSVNVAVLLRDMDA